MDCDSWLCLFMKECWIAIVQKIFFNVRYFLLTGIFIVRDCGNNVCQWLQNAEYMFICQKQPMTDILSGGEPQADT